MISQIHICHLANRVRAEKDFQALRQSGPDFLQTPPKTLTKPGLPIQYKPVQTKLTPWELQRSYSSTVCLSSMDCWQAIHTAKAAGNEAATVKHKYNPFESSLYYNKRK